MADLPYRSSTLRREAEASPREQVMDVAQKYLVDDSSPSRISIRSRFPASPLRASGGSTPCAVISPPRRAPVARGRCAGRARAAADPALGDAARRAGVLRGEPRSADARRERRLSGGIGFDTRDKSGRASMTRTCCGWAPRHGRRRDRAQARRCRARSFRRRFDTDRAGVGLRTLSSAQERDRRSISSAFLHSRISRGRARARKSARDRRD